ncbi:hypothetical protein BH18ACT6_BH18ACT6_03950 [soil metagenome]
MVDKSRRRLIAPSVIAVIGAAGAIWQAAEGWVGFDALLLMAAVVFVAVGVIVLARASGNRLGWVLSLIGLSLIGAGIAELLNQKGLVAGEAIGGTLWLSWFVLAGFLFLWFPTGRVPSRRWRFLEWIGFVGAAVSLSYLVAGEICLETNDDGICTNWARNPIGIPAIPNPEYGPLGGLNTAVLGVFIVASIGGIAYRFFRSRGVERLQLKWLLLSAVALFAIALVQESVPMPLWLGGVLFGLGVVALPVSIGVAILKYRLYDIDRIISRTLGYGLVVVFLALVYVTIAVWLPTRVTGEQSPIFVAGATLLAAALFNPVRRRVIRAVDRRFHRSRYDPDRVMSDFAGRLREQVDMERLTSDWLGVVIRTMSPASAGVWMRER